MNRREFVGTALLAGAAGGVTRDIMRGPDKTSISSSREPAKTTVMFTLRRKAGLTQAGVRHTALTARYYPDDFQNWDGNAFKGLVIVPGYIQARNVMESVRGDLKSMGVDAAIRPTYRTLRVPTHDTERPSTIYFGSPTDVANGNFKGMSVNYVWIDDAHMLGTVEAVEVLESLRFCLRRSPQEMLIGVCYSEGMTRPPVIGQLVANPLVRVVDLEANYRIYRAGGV